MGRAAFLMVAVFAVLAQMTAGFMGPASSLCVCSACIAIERSYEECRPSTSEAKDLGKLIVVGEGDCSHCHVIPLPDMTYTPIASAPAQPIPADLPLTKIVPSLVVWPPRVATQPSSAYRQRPPPDQHLRNLRTVVMTC